MASVDVIARGIVTMRTFPIESASIRAQGIAFQSRPGTFQVDLYLVDNQYDADRMVVLATARGGGSNIVNYAPAPTLPDFGPGVRFIGGSLLEPAEISFSFQILEIVDSSLLTF